MPPSEPVLPKSTTPSEALRVLVLQGGGALGSYQAGAFQALCGCGIEADWVAGISIGAINAALIAGNAPDQRLARIRQFWEMTTVPAPWTGAPPEGDWRAMFDEANAAVIATVGVPGFFTPRFPPPPLWPPDDVTALSYYDTASLRETLQQLVDFERLNSGDMRVSIGAVNVATGELRYFDNRSGDRIGPEHIMASAALPPGFPAVKIEDAYYWDGGISSNTPLDHVLEQAADDLLIFQLDLFSARGRLPQTMREAVEREKDIRFSSRTFRNTEKNEALHNARRSISRLIASLPDELKQLAAVQELASVTREHTVTVLHLVYRSKTPEVASRDYNFSRVAMDEHWSVGRADVECAMRDRAWLKLPQNGETMVVYELDNDAAGECAVVRVRPADIKRRE